MFKMLKVAEENKSGKRIWEAMMVNTRKLSMDKMLGSVKLHTVVPYHPTSKGVAKRMIRVLTDAVHAMPHGSSVSKPLWAEAFSTTTHVRNRTTYRLRDVV